MKIFEFPLAKGDFSADVPAFDIARFFQVDGCLQKFSRWGGARIACGTKTLHQYRRKNCGEIKKVTRGVDIEFRRPVIFKSCRKMHKILTKEKIGGRNG